MLPFSENLAINNAFFSKVKENLLDPTVNSKIGNYNIWVSNLQTNHDINNISSDFSLHKTTIDAFEVSRLWNQKRGYLTLLSKFSQNKLAVNYISTVDLSTNSNTRNCILDTTPVIGLLNIDYINYRNTFLLSYLKPEHNSIISTASAYPTYLSGSNLNM